jgi:hypothetical protein
MIAICVTTVDGFVFGVKSDVNDPAATIQELNPYNKVGWMNAGITNLPEGKCVCCPDAVDRLKCRLHERMCYWIHLEFRVDDPDIDNRLREAAKRAIVFYEDPTGEINQ